MTPDPHLLKPMSIPTTKPLWPGACAGTSAAQFRPLNQPPPHYDACSSPDLPHAVGAVGHPRADIDANTVTSVTTTDTNPTGSFGYALMALSTIGFSSNSFLVHVAEAHFAFPPASSVFVRGLVQTVLSLSYLIGMAQFTATLRSITRRQAQLLAVRGFVGSLAIMSLYMSVQLIPVGDAVAIFFIGPAITIVLSSVILHEPVSVVEVFAAVLSIFGAALVTRADAMPAAASEAASTALMEPARRVIGSLCALISASLAAVAITAIRHLGASVHFMTAVVSFGLFATATAIPFGGVIGLPSLLSYGYGTVSVLAAAVFGFMGQCCITLGLQRCRIAPGILLLNLEVPLSYVLGLAFLGERPTILRAIGSILVFVAAVVIGLQS